MLEMAKNIALTIAIVGFGLSVLLPFHLQINSIMNRLNGFFLELFGMLICIVSGMLFVLYFIISFYYIWIN